MIWVRFSRSMAALQPGDLERGPHDLLRHLHAEGRVPGDLCGLGVRDPGEGVGGDDVDDEADAVRLLGVDDATGEHELLGPGGADDAGEEPARADVAGAEPDADEGGVEPRLGGGEADVAAQDEGEPASAGGTVDRCDDRLAEAPELGDERGDLLLDGEALLDPATAVSGRRGLAVAAEVEAGAEPAPCAGEDDHPAVGVASRFVERVVEGRDEAGVHGVEPVGPVEGDRRDARRVAGFEQDGRFGRGGHGCGP